MAILKDLGGPLGSGNELFAGEDVLLTDTITGVDVTQWSGSIYIRKVGSATPLLSKPWSVLNGPGGQIQMTLAAADTGTTLGPGKWRFEIARTDGGNYTVLTYGQLWLLART